MDKPSLFTAPDGTGFDNLEFRNYYCYVLTSLQNLESRWLGSPFETVLLEVVADIKQTGSRVFPCGSTWDGGSWPEGYIQHSENNLLRYQRGLQDMSRKHPTLEFLISSFKRRLRSIDDSGKEYRDEVTRGSVPPNSVCYRQVEFQSVFA